MILQCLSRVGGGETAFVHVSSGHAMSTAAEHVASLKTQPPAEPGLAGHAPSRTSMYPNPALHAVHQEVGPRTLLQQIHGLGGSADRAEAREP